MKASVYVRPDKPRTLSVTRRKEAPLGALPNPSPVIAVDRATECHVTPPAVAARLVKYLGDCSTLPVLEPEAGPGNIVDAIVCGGNGPSEVVAVERHITLFDTLYQRFITNLDVHCVNECFLAYSEQHRGKRFFPRIVMNPPFRHTQKHLDAALKLLGNEHGRAVLVAIVPMPFEHWEAETLEHLDPNCFSATKVYTKIIRITR